MAHGMRRPAEPPRQGVVETVAVAGHAGNWSRRGGFTESAVRSKRMVGGYATGQDVPDERGILKRERRVEPGATESDTAVDGGHGRQGGLWAMQSASMGGG